MRTWAIEDEDGAVGVVREAATAVARISAVVPEALATLGSSGAVFGAAKARPEPSPEDDAVTVSPCP